MNQSEKQPRRPLVSRNITSETRMSDSVSVAAPFKPPRAPQSNPAVPFPNESSIWEVYVNESIVVDNELVKDWTSSLNFLLAAIFSSVLSAFIIESKKLLEQDSAEVMVDVLIFLVNNNTNGTH
ncbi:16680_t:CDS:2, partial [Acaulospora colombiana]